MDGSSVASIGAAICRASTWHRMYVYGKSGPTPLSAHPGAQYRYGSTVEVGWINCVYMEIQCVDLGVKIRQQVYSGSTLEDQSSTSRVLFQTKVEQTIDANWNQMEQSKGLRVVESKDMVVGLSRGQPWKGDPIKPVKAVKGWFHQDCLPVRMGIRNKDQSGCSKLSEFKYFNGFKGRGKFESINRIGINNSINNSIRRREINWIN